MAATGPESRPAVGARTLTPAVVLAAAFLFVCAVVSIGFVAARGGLELPLAGPADSGIARASVNPQGSPTPSGPTGSPSPGGQPSGGPPASPGPTPVPSAAPTPAATPDPLAVLPPCPDHPGCYLYTIQRGDTLSTIADRWLIPITTLEALNPQIGDPSTIVVGQVLYLGRSPYVRLDRCPGQEQGCYLYVVRPGDRLSTIAGQFGTTVTAILALNPAISDPNAIYSGQTIHLPGP